jgi:hypothetical protein
MDASDMFKMLPSYKNIVEEATAHVHEGHGDKASAVCGVVQVEAAGDCGRGRGNDRETIEK